MIEIAYGLPTVLVQIYDRDQTASERASDANTPNAQAILTPQLFVQKHVFVTSKLNIQNVTTQTHNNHDCY